MVFKDEIFMVAEVSANHGHDIRVALDSIDAAKEAGADAVKFQAYEPSSLTIDCDNKYFFIDHPEWGEQTLYKLYKKAYTPFDWFPKLKERADRAGITFFATAFDKKGIDLLESIGVPFHKAASFELVDTILIEYMAEKGKPLILSTGMASEAEIEDALSVVRKYGNEVVLLKCVSSYPADLSDMNLNTIPDMRSRFGVDVGLSDHSLGDDVPFLSVAFGVKMIEKHFTLSRANKTPDSFFSMEPDEFKRMVFRVREAEKIAGGIRYGAFGGQEKSKIFRRSLFVVKDIRKGEKFSEDNLKSIRPGYGLPVKYYREILGKRAVFDILRGTPLSFDMVEGICEPY